MQKDSIMPQDACLIQLFGMKIMQFQNC